MNYSCINTAKDSFQEIEEKIKIQKIKREVRKFSLGYIYQNFLPTSPFKKCNYDHKEEFIYEFDQKSGDYALFLIYDKEQPRLYTISNNPDELVEDFLKYLTYYEEIPSAFPAVRNWEIETECLLFTQISRSVKQKLNYFILHKYESLFQKI